MSRLVPDCYSSAPLFEDFSTMYSDFSYSPSIESKLFVALEGLNSGVPTRTTATLTPTTLRNIEQTFLELQPQHTNHSAGFVPPVVHHANHTSTMNSGGGTVFVNSELAKGWQQPSAPSSPSLSSSPAPATTTRRNVGGRRPVKDDKCTPEEEARRSVRRERNKLAAARCRKRRLDHTNELVEETEGLEAKKQAMQAEIQQLQRDKEELEFLLEAHRPCCRLQQQDLKRPPPRLVPRRPSTLAVAPAFKNEAGVNICTPSTGLNFDSLMAGGTGLTPVATCASQTREAGSPEASGGGGQKLVAL
ncbi:transcription factor kayak isoform X2 [Neocloeon triangulifer]|uniref:transcription factor kayak isoform X2 n=1 Tax=Neocloeon triangulifer TaxID=2078957 RepID=UPI00286ECB4D|nr:transcription factor kayak isoform X2 [Neocloeon triangulifer]